jgi:hypothetical protein
MVYFCILILCLLLSTAPAQAKWWQIFHRHKQDSTVPVQPVTSAPMPAPAPAYTSRTFSPAPTPYSGGSSLTPAQTATTLLEPPPLPARPPIPDPPQIVCPAPLGSGIPKPALAWRAKSIKQLAALPAATPHSPAIYSAAGVSSAVSVNGAASMSGAVSASGLSLSKTFPAKFDDAFMAALLACSRTGLTIRNVDSTQGKLEATTSGTGSQISVIVQVNHDLLDTTNVSCSSTTANRAARSLLGNLFSNITSELVPTRTAAARIPSLEQSK